MPTPAQIQGAQALAEQRRGLDVTPSGSDAGAAQVMQGDQQAQAPQDPSAGLGTPPPPPFEYRPNPSTTLMNQHVADQLQKKAEEHTQAALAAKSAAQQATNGYAGHGNVPADVQNSQGGSNQPHPNEGWSPKSEEAHQLNVELANRIKSGTIDPQTAMAAIQHEDVAPEIRQALSMIIQHAQGQGANGMGGTYGSPYGRSGGISAQDIQNSAPSQGLGNIAQ